MESRMNTFNIQAKPSILARATELIQSHLTPPPVDPSPDPAPTTGTERGTGTPEYPKGPEKPKRLEKLVKQPTFVSRSSIKVTFSKPHLENEADLDKWLKATRDAYARELKEGRMITL